ncbi:MAG: hypothetical protein KF838_06405 [Phycisphaeraceae bacterium]|nr:MAG: hypothetical protein KF838_06405 [Phycisphaeraceae bacterium]
MRHHIRQTLFACATIAIVGAASCSMPGARSEPRPSSYAGAAQPVAVSASMTLQDARRVQSEVMDFADDMTIRLAEAIDQLEVAPSSLESRTIAHRLKFTVAHGATIIAAAQNPRIALVDMLVMISLQRALIERNIVPGRYGAEADRLRAVFESSESQIRGLAERSLTKEQLTEIDRLIQQWLDENPTRRYAAYVRLSDFADARQVTTGQAGPSRPSNVLGFLFLDPLSGLDPTTREIEQTRLFAERAMFYLQRAPMLLSWQAELLYIDTISEPEARQILANVASTSDAITKLSDEFAELRQQLPNVLATERRAIMESLDGTIDTQRRAAIEQAAAALRAEREATISQLASEQERLGAVIADLHTLVGASTTLAESVREAAMSGTELALALGLDEPSEPGSATAKLAAYTEAMRQTTLAADRLGTLAEALVSATNPDLVESRLAVIEQRLENAEDSANRLLDRAFRMGVMLIAMLVIGLAGIVVLASVLGVFRAKRAQHSAA